MTQKKTKLILTSLLLVLLSMMTMTSAAPSDSPSPIITRGVPVPGSGNYNDGLGTTTYRDSGNTTAVGWGSGVVTNPRAGGLVAHLDTLYLTDEIYSVELQGRKLYTTLYDPGSPISTVRVFNASDPTDLTLLGTRSSSSYLISGEVDGDIMTVGSSTGWLSIYNVSDPTNILSPIYTDTLTGDVTDIEFQGRHMYVASYQSSGYDLHIYDIEDPSNAFQTHGSGWSELLGLAVQGDILYCADGSYGLYLVNVSNAYGGAPTLDIYDTLGNATDVIVDGDYAYVADGTSGIDVIDCSDPTNIVKVDGYSLPGNAVDLELQGDTLIVACGWSGVRFLDVSDPTSIRYAGQLNTIYARDIDVQDGILAIAASKYLYTYRIGLLTNPAHYSTYSTYDALDVEVQGDIAYVAAGTDGLVVLDVSDRVNPVLLDRIQVPGTCYYTSVDVEGIHCYVTNDVATDEGVYVFDVSDPTNVVHIEYDSWSRGLDIFVHGDTAMFADAQYGYYQLNVSDPWNIPIHLYYDAVSIDNVSSVFAQGRFAYTAGHEISASGNRGVFIYDITDLTNIRVTDNVGLIDVEDVDVCGDFMAVADGQFGLYLYNITDPWDISYMDYINFGARCYGVKIYGNYILCAVEGSFRIVDATDPHDISTLYSYTTGSPRCLSIDCDGDFAYVACRDRLLVFRIFNSHADTWDTSTRYAQSIEVDTTVRTIENATLTYAIGVDFGSSGATVGWQLSADGGFNWESVVGGSPHTFTSQGNVLLWRATLSSSYNDRTPYISWVDIDYEYNDLPTAPVLTDPGTTDTDGAFTASWSVSTDASGSVASYQLQIDTSNTFSSPASHVETTTSHAFTGLTNDTYYLRVRALDDDGEYGDWSSTESITVAIPPTTTTPTTPPPPPPIPGFPVATIIIGISSALAMILVLRRRNLRKH